MRTLLCGAAALAALLSIAPVAAVASAEVSGSPQAVSIKAQNSSIEEILSLLGREFNMQYHSSADLQKQLTGTYQGSLQRVLTRVLEGYNFIVKTSDGRIEVTVFGTKSAPGTAVAAAITAASKTSPDAATAAPAVEAKTQAPSNKAVEQPPPSLPAEAVTHLAEWAAQPPPSLPAGGSLEIEGAEAKLSNLVPTPSSAVPAIPSSAASGPGP